MAKIYRGSLGLEGQCMVTVEEQGGKPKRLPPRYDLRNHSPSGYNWSFSGSGPAQLALALCANALGDDERAQRVYQQFKFRVVAKIDGDSWTLTDAQVLEAIHDIEAAREAGAGFDVSDSPVEA